MTKADALLALANKCERETPSKNLDAAIREALRETLGIWPSGSPKRYTSSLDLAMSLMPEGDDVFWRSGHDGEGPDPGLFRAEVLLASLPGGSVVARAQTESVARCAAALRAHAALSPTDGARPTTSQGQAPQPSPTYSCKEGHER